MIFFRYRAHLEAELLRLEELLKLVIAVKDRVIQRQDEEIKMLRAKCERLELLVIPGLRPAPGKKLEPRQIAPEGETAWAAYVKRHMEEEDKIAAKAKEQANNGVSLEKRAVVHQPASGNAQRSNGSGTAGDAQRTPSGDA